MMRSVSGAASLAAALALAFTAAACDAGGDGADGPEIMSVRGLVQEVDARSLLEIDSVTVRDGDGREWVIEGGGTEIPGFSPSHVREHMVLGQTVTAFFHRKDGVLVLDDMTD